MTAQKEFKLAAERDAESWWNEANERLKYSIEYASSGLKSLFLANGGSIIALLTFVGNAKKPINPIGIYWAFVWFVCGVLSIMLAYVAAYQSQAYLMAGAYTRSWHHKSFAADQQSDYDPVPWERRGNLAVKIAISCAVASLGLFATGALVALSAIT